jgi:hypothetical protein
VFVSPNDKAAMTPTALASATHALHFASKRTGRIIVTLAGKAEAWAIRLDAGTRWNRGRGDAGESSFTGWPQRSRRRSPRYSTSRPSDHHDGSDWRIVVTV